MKDQLEALVAQMYGSGILYSEAVREFKKRFILNVLRQNKGNQCRAARELGMHRNTLGRTISELKIDIRQFRGQHSAFSTQHSVHERRLTVASVRPVVRPGAHGGIAG